MEQYLERTGAMLRASTDLHIIALLDEMEGGRKVGPLTCGYVDDVITRMVANGSSTDVKIHGIPEALQRVEFEIMKEAARRWRMLLKEMRIEEKREIHPIEKKD